MFTQIVQKPLLRFEFSEKIVSRKGTNLRFIDKTPSPVYSSVPCLFVPCLFPKHIYDSLLGMGLELWDIKLEIGRIQIDGQPRWAIIDEVGPGNMRVYKDGKKLDKQELARLVLAGR